MKQTSIKIIPIAFIVATIITGAMSHTPVASSNDEGTNTHESNTNKVPAMEPSFTYKHENTSDRNEELAQPSRRKPAVPIKRSPTGQSKRKRISTPKQVGTDNVSRSITQETTLHGIDEDHDLSGEGNGYYYPAKGNYYIDYYYPSPGKGKGRHHTGVATRRYDDGKGYCVDYYYTRPRSPGKGKGYYYKGLNQNQQRPHANYYYAENYTTGSSGKANRYFSGRNQQNNHNYNGYFHKPAKGKGGYMYHEEPIRHRIRDGPYYASMYYRSTGKGGKGRMHHSSGIGMHAPSKMTEQVVSPSANGKGCPAPPAEYNNDNDSMNNGHEEGHPENSTTDTDMDVGSPTNGKGYVYYRYYTYGTSGKGGKGHSTGKPMLVDGKGYNYDYYFGSSQYRYGPGLRLKEGSKGKGSAKYYDADNVYDDNYYYGSGFENPVASQPKSGSYAPRSRSSSGIETTATTKGITADIESRASKLSKAGFSN